MHTDSKNNISERNSLSNTCKQLFNLFLNPIGRIGIADYVLGLFVLFCLSYVFTKMNFTLPVYLLLVPFWMLTVKRLHDQNYSFIYSLLLLIPIINVALLFMCIFFSGYTEENTYGKRKDSLISSFPAI